MNTRRLFLILALTLANPVASICAADHEMLFTTPFMDLHDQPTNLQAYRGKPLMVNFWARACPPCREELPLLNSVSHRYAQDLTVIGIAVEEQTEAVRDFVSAYELDYPILVGQQAGIRLMADFGNHIAGLPFTVFINARGELVRQKTGALTEAEIVDALGVLLGM